MPLIVLTGPPCCGKTTFAKQLLEALERLKSSSSSIIDGGGTDESAKSLFCKTLHLVNEESELPAQTKFQSYESSFQEKSTRAAIKSSVSHKIGAEALVIADSTNYIKGFRYELYCVSRTYRSPHCVVWVETREDVANTWNSKRTERESLPQSLMTELRQRFEAPNDKNRWDYPLFRVDMTPDKDISATLNPKIDSAVVMGEVGGSGGGEKTAEPNVDASAPAPVAVKSAWKPKAKKIAASANKVEASLVKEGGAGGNELSLSSLSSLTISDQPTTIFTLSSISSESNPATPSSSSGRSDVKADGTGVWFSGTNIKNEYSSLGEPADIVIGKIIAYFQNATAATPHASTLNVTHSSADMLYELDRTSKEIVDKVVSHQNIIGQEGTPLIFAEFNRSFTSQRHIGSVELQRHRRQFVKVNSSHPPASIVDIGSSFIDFLATQI